MKAALAFSAVVICACLNGEVALIDPASPTLNDSNQIEQWRETNDKEVLRHLEKFDRSAEAALVNVELIASAMTNEVDHVIRSGAEKINEVILEKGFYEKRYNELKDAYDQFMDRLDKWLTVIGILVALLGFGVPLIISMLQRCEVKKLIHQARADIRKEVFISRKAKEREIDLLRKDSLKALHMLVWENFAMVDLLGSSAIDKKVLLASVIVCIHELLECAMRTCDAKCVATEIAAVRAFVGRWSDASDGSRKEIWNGACRIVKSSIQSGADACRRSDYDRVLHADSEDFKWLESFYKDFASWKFA